MREKAKSLEQQKTKHPPTDSPSVPAVNIAIAQLDTAEGLTLKEVAELIGMNYSRLSSTKNKMSETDFLRYLSQKSGQVWRFDATGRGKYSVVHASP